MDDNEHEEEVGLGHIVANLWPRKMIFDLLPDDVQFCAVVAGATLQLGLGPADDSAIKLTLLTVRFLVKGYGVYIENIHESS